MKNSMLDRRWRRTALILALSFMAACSGGGGGGDDDDDGGGGPPPALTESRTYRAVAGVSMGGYAALNLGTKHSDLFGTIGSLGGPVDLQQLLRDSVADNLEVKAQTTIPRAVGEDFTFDHLPPYPDRDSRVEQTQDLIISFGNPFLHHPDPARLYLAADSQPATLLRDDQFDAFTLTDDPRGFLDGGDGNADGLRQTGEQPTEAVDVLLLARGSAQTLSGGVAGQLIGDRELVDLNGDGVYDVGDGIVVNYSEPFTDSNGDLIFDPGETFEDVGLDGVAGTADLGEGNGQFDYDPDRANFLAEDPTSRLAARSGTDISTQRIYMDVGIQDEFGFARHYDNLVSVLRGKGLTVAVQEGFAGGNCGDLPDDETQFKLVRYDAGHIGVAKVDPDDLFDGNVCGEDTVWQRLLSLLGYLDRSFPDGFDGPGGDDGDFDFDFDGIDDLDDIDIDIDLPDLDPDLRGDVLTATIDSPALATAGGPVPTREVLVYRPPAFHRTDRDFPVAYFLIGYGQEPEDYDRLSLLLDGLILTGQLQNMFVVILPGSGGRQGSFYVNHVVPETQVPAIEQVTSGRYEDSTIDDLIPVIEDQLLERRVKR
jgi:enterochelin esterase-like enzyme